MSLIYSALNKLEQEPATPGAPEGSVANPYVATARKSGPPRWVYLVVSACGLIVFGGWLATTVLAPRPGVASLPGPVALPAIAPPATATPALASQLVVEPGAVAVVLNSPVLPPPVLPPPEASPVKPVLLAQAEVTAQVPAVDIKATPTKAPPAPPRARAVPKPASPLITEEVVPEVAINPDDTRQLTLAVKRAIQAGKTSEAEGLLKQLATRLPTESITLLRLNAWNKMQGGDQAQAMALYRQIVERLPGDESASINLALLHWQTGQQDEARRLIGALAERHPESDTVQRYSREFGVLR